MASGESSGYTLVYERTVNGNQDLYVAPAGGGIERRITDDPATDGLPRWSRDGSSILFGSDRSGNWQLYSVGPRGGEARETARLALRVVYEPVKVVPEEPPPLVSLEAVQPLPRGAGPGDRLPLDPGRPAVVHSPRVRLLGHVRAATNLARVARVRDGKEESLARIDAQSAS